MSTKIGSKLNRLLQSTVPGSVLLSSWLVKQGYSHDLQQRYLKSGWLESIGSGAYKRAGDTVSVFGGLHALQYQAQKSIHVGGYSALVMQGLAHYVKMENDILYLFAQTGFKLPRWFENKDWGQKYELKTTKSIPPDLSIINHQMGSLPVKISSPARAILEFLDTANTELDWEETFFIMESLNNLHPNTVQELLEKISSVKAKRLFLFLAEKAAHSWFNQLNLSGINLGSGKRSFVTRGVYNSKYQITVPNYLS